MKITGKMAEVVEKYFSDAGFRKIDDMAELEHRITNLVRVHDLRIFFADHGKCFIKSQPLESRCNQVTGGASWHKVVPNFSARTPGMCSGCSCFGVDASHLPYWEAREETTTSALKAAEAAGAGPEYYVIKARAEQSKKIVELIKRYTKKKS